MKEGYLQMKIAEFNDKCNQIEQTLSMEEAKIRLLQEKVGEYKEIIKKFQDIQEFKHQAILEIRKENESILKNQIEQVSQQLSELLTEITTSKAEKINEALQALQKRNEQIDKQEEIIKQNTKELIFLLEHNEILMMKLINRKVLSEHDIIEMQRRAAKKAEKI
jgi:uncharacterized phage infection (PIP) family protein YhgE